jgi:hypothetical protein
MRLKLGFYALIFFNSVFSCSALANADFDAQRVSASEEWLLPKVLASKTQVLNTRIVATLQNAANIKISLNSVCSVLDAIQQTALTETFYFGKNTDGTKPYCLLSKFDLTIGNSYFSVPSDALGQFVDAPQVNSVKWTWVSGKAFMVRFKGGSGLSEYEARLTFLDGRMTRQQVRAYDLELKKNRIFDRSFAQ